MRLGLPGPRDLGAERATADFIRTNLPLTPVPGTGIALHLADPRSGLSGLVGDGPTPYWAYAWPGGVALAMHLTAQPGPERHRGRPLPAFDIGAGSGIAAIAAARLGHHVIAIDPDPLALVALDLNAAANGVEVDTVAARCGGFNAHFLIPTPVLFLAGDVFYNESVTAEVTACLDRQPGECVALVGDIGRPHLPRDRLDPLASYPVRDVGDPPTAPPREGWVFRWR